MQTRRNIIRRIIQETYCDVLCIEWCICLKQFRKRMSANNNDATTNTTVNDNDKDSNATTDENA